MNTKKLVLCGMFAAVTCVLSPWSIPLPTGIPISLATFAVMLAGCLLGPKLGTASQAVYVLLGAVGLPVFSGMRGGFGVLTGMTGGYIIAYILLAFLCGLIYFRFGRSKTGTVKIVWLVIAMLVGTAALYIFGTAWFIFLTGMNLAGAMAACVIPFLPGDAVKIIAVVLLTLPLEKALRRMGS